MSDSASSSPPDLADLHEHAVYNMFTNIFRWTGSEVL